jgi:hypothetical protein
VDYFVICLISFVGSGLTLFSGFGLGTLLMPVFAIFFPVDLAIGMTAIVHLLNNIFKFILLRKHADKAIVLKFGIPSLLAAFAGAWLLTQISDLSPLFTYVIGTKELHITPVKLLIGALLIFFCFAESAPFLSRLSPGKKHFMIGGLLSGFFGGLSGNQGALRSAFLMKANLSKEQFIATGIVIACMVDIARLFVYNRLESLRHSEVHYGILIAAIFSAFAGAWIGNTFLKKITITSVQRLVAGMLLLAAVLLIMGVI